MSLSSSSTKKKKSSSRLNIGLTINTKVKPVRSPSITKSPSSTTKSSKSVPNLKINTSISPRHESIPTPKSKNLVGEIASRSMQNENCIQSSCEKILVDHLCSMKSILLKSQIEQTAYDVVNVSNYLNQRSQEAVEEDLSRLIVKLNYYQGPRSTHRLTAYTQLSKILALELENEIFTDEKKAVDLLKSELRSIKDENNESSSIYNHELAIKDQIISNLNQDKLDLETKNRDLIRLKESIQKEYEKSIRNQSKTNQEAVEVKMQGIDFKNEVDRRCNKILTSIKQRVGFIPQSIEKQVLFLKVMKPPGDAEYDEVRMLAFKQINKKNIKIREKSTSYSGKFENENSASLHWIQRFLKADDDINDGGNNGKNSVDILDNNNNNDNRKPLTEQTESQEWLKWTQDSNFRNEKQEELEEMQERLDEMEQEFKRNNINSSSNDSNSSTSSSNNSVDQMTKLTANDMNEYERSQQIKEWISNLKGNEFDNNYGDEYESGFSSSDDDDDEDLLSY
jgi:hypothetical protein